MTDGLRLPDVPDHDKKYVRAALPILVSKLNDHQVNVSVLGLETPQDTLDAYFGLYVVIEQGLFSICALTGRSPGQVITEFVMLASDGEEGRMVELDLLMASHAVAHIVCSLKEADAGVVSESDLYALRFDVCRETVMWDAYMITGMAKLSVSSVQAMCAVIGFEPDAALSLLGLAVAA